MPVATEYAYITTNESILGGKPIIRGTRKPVRAIVELYCLGISPEEVPIHLPHFTLAQVFDALSFYSDHQVQIDGYIKLNSAQNQFPIPA